MGTIVLLAVIALTVYAMIPFRGQGSKTPAGRPSSASPSVSASVRIGPVAGNVAGNTAG